jgi:hypothetical protein
MGQSVERLMIANCATDLTVACCGSGPGAYIGRPVKVGSAALVYALSVRAFAIVATRRNCRPKLLGQVPTITSCSWAAYAIGGR